MKEIMPPEQKGQMRSFIITGTILIAIATAAMNISGIWSKLMVFIGCLKPFMLGTLLALLQFPIARAVEPLFARLFSRRKPHPKLCRGLSTFVSLAGLLGLIAVFFSIILPEVVRSVTSLSTTVRVFIEKNSEFINSMVAQYDIPFLTLSGDSLTIAWEELIGEATNSVTLILTNIMSIGTAIYQIVFQLFVGIITSMYLLFDRDRLCATFKKLTYAFLSRQNANVLIRWTRRAGDIFTGFISGKAVDSLIIGILCYICMLLFGYEYALLISTVIGLTNMIPFFGPFIGAIPSVLILAIVDPYHAIGFLIFVIVLQQLDGNIIGPLILGDYVGLSPLWIMIAIVIGSTLYGFIGMLLGIPVFALIYGIIREFSSYRLRKQDLPDNTDSYIAFPPKEEKKTVSRMPWNRRKRNRK